MCGPKHYQHRDEIAIQLWCPICEDRKEFKIRSFRGCGAHELNPASPTNSYYPCPEPYMILECKICQAYVGVQ